ncbi:MAG: hypothetical protein Q9163_002971 [Psora crenata]
MVQAVQNYWHTVGQSRGMSQGRGGGGQSDLRHRTDKLEHGQVEVAAGHRTGEYDQAGREPCWTISSNIRSAVESTATGSCCRELAEVKKDLKTLKAHTRLDDYAANVCNNVKNLCWGTKIVAEVKNELKTLKAHTRLGDYAGNVTSVGAPGYPLRADILAQRLEKEAAANSSYGRVTQLVTD